MSGRGHPIVRSSNFVLPKTSAGSVLLDCSLVARVSSHTCQVMFYMQRTNTSIRSGDAIEKYCTRALYDVSALKGSISARYYARLAQMRTYRPLLSHLLSVTWRGSWSYLHRRTFLRCLSLSNRPALGTYESPI